MFGLPMQIWILGGDADSWRCATKRYQINKRLGETQRRIDCQRGFGECEPRDIDSAKLQQILNELCRRSRFVDRGTKIPSPRFTEQLSI
jgi:hypothetical protein